MPVGLSREQEKCGLEGSLSNCYRQAAYCRDEKRFLNNESAEMMEMWRWRRALGCVGLVVLGGTVALGRIGADNRSTSVQGLPQNVAIEYGTVTVDAKWEGDQTRGSAFVTFRTQFAEAPVVLANQYGRGGWHFFVHAQSTKEQAHFSVMLDRSFQGKEPRIHPCEIAYVAIGKTVAP